MVNKKGDNVKKILLIVTIFLLTGCTATYNLTIDEDVIKENVNVNIPTELIDEDELSFQVDNSDIVYFNGKQKYNTKLTNNYDKYLINYKFEHKLNDYSNSKFVIQCYQNTNLEETDDQIKLATSNEFKCIKMYDGVYLNSAQINITTDLKVLENNADEINGNTYTWNINEENYTNKPINITMQKKIGIKSVVKSLEGNSASKDLFIIYGGLALLLGLIILLVTIKLKSNNKI